MSIRQGEGNDRVLRAIIRPEQFAIERKRTTRKWNYGNVCNGGGLLFQIQSSDSPIFVRLFLSAQNVERAVGKSVTGDLGPNVNLADNAATIIELQYLAFYATGSGKDFFRRS